MGLSYFEIGFNYIDKYQMLNNDYYDVIME